MTPTLLIGSDCPDVRSFAAVLSADVLWLPAFSRGDGWKWAQRLESWRAEAAAGPRHERVVAAAWPPSPEPGMAADLDLAGWEARAEQPLARWAVALGCAVSRCADGGSVVAVVDGPTALECGGWAPETAVAEGIRALCRSLALSEGQRGVRVNVVSTPARLPVGEVLQPPPPLAGYPGTLERDVAGAVRMLLSADAAGVTGGIVHADAGRAWR